MDLGGTEARLRAHVAAFAGTIGERTSSDRARSPRRAATSPSSSGRRAVPQPETFLADGHVCMDVVAVRPGRSRAGEALG
jgi:hypothetical protein